jgi:hypothetical protein
MGLAYFTDNRSARLITGSAEREPLERPKAKVGYNARQSVDCEFHGKKS